MYTGFLLFIYKLIRVNIKGDKVRQILLVTKEVIRLWIENTPRYEL